MHSLREQDSHNKINQISKSQSFNDKSTLMVSVRNIVNESKCSFPKLKGSLEDTSKKLKFIAHQLLARKTEMMWKQQEYTPRALYLQQV